MVGDTTERLARDGGRAAFDALYSRTLPALVVWASMRIPRAQRGLLAPEDVAQEVWFRALRVFDTYDPAKGGFRAWIIGVAKNVLLDATRHLGRPDVMHRAGESSSATPHLNRVPDDVTAASQRVTRHEDVARSLELLSTLNREERDLFLHLGMEEMAHEEVARMLGLEKATLSKRWQRLRARLRDAPVFRDLDSPG